MSEEVVRLVYWAPPKAQHSSEEDKNWGEIQWGGGREREA